MIASSIMRRGIGLLAALAAAGAHADGTITLRPALRIAQGEPLRLANIATLTGDDATAHADLAISATGESITIDEVREALKAADPDLHWGRLTLSGTSCRVVRIGQPTPEAKAQTPVIPAQIAPVTTGPTVRSTIVPHVAACLGVTPERLRLEFDDREMDRELLDVSIAERTLEAKPVGASDRLPISITVYERDRIIAKGIARARVSILTDVVVARSQIARGSPLTVDVLENRQEWLGLSARPLVPADAPGAVARARIVPGQLLTVQDAQAPIAIRKGEQAMVHCLSGSLVLKLRARALEDGRPGDTIEFTGMDGRKGRVILARVDRAGVAIAIDDSTPSMSAIDTPVTSRSDMP